MIINHKYKFIFIKTRKTAGTSAEIALSNFCHKGDIITPLDDEDELIRQELGLRGPQNYNVPLRFYRRRDWLHLLRTGHPMQYHRHASALFIRSHLDEEIWRSYFKFCFERNPFDKAISRYYWSTEEPRPALSDYLDAVPVHQLSNWHLYTINDQIAVDFIGRYETFVHDLATIAQKLALPAPLDLPKAKGHYRADRRHYSNVIDVEARSRIELVCAKEIKAFHYVWRDTQYVACSSSDGSEGFRKETLGYV